MTRKPSGPIGQMQKDRAETFMTNCKRQVTCKPSGPTGWMEMGRRVPQVGWRWRMVPQVHVTRKPSGPTGRMLKGPVGTRRIEKGLSRNFYDELQASRMRNCRSHRNTSDGEGTMWRSMMKHRRYRSNIVHHKSVISSMTKLCSS